MGRPKAWWCGKVTTRAMAQCRQCENASDKYIILVLVVFEEIQNMSDLGHIYIVTNYKANLKILGN